MTLPAPIIEALAIGLFMVLCLTGLGIMMGLTELFERYADDKYKLEDRR